MRSKLVDSTATNTYGSEVIRDSAFAARDAAGQANDDHLLKMQGGE